MEQNPKAIKRYATYSLCLLIFTIFKRQMYFFVISNEVHWKEIKETYSCFFFPLFHKLVFSPGLPRATRLHETSCLEKITVFVIETMLVTLPLVQMNRAQREVNWTNQIQTKINRYSNVCYTLNPWEHVPLNIKSNEIFFKKHLLVETFSSDN